MKRRDELPLDPVCRIEIREVHDEEYWTAYCVCGWADASALAIECLEAALAHYKAEPHNGYMFIDLKPEGVTDTR
jgi:hypothetical protein